MQEYLYRLLIISLFMIAYVCYRAAWRLIVTWDKYEPQLFIGSSAVRKAARKARRLSL